MNYCGAPEAVGSRLQRQTVSKVNFLKMLSNKINGLQILDAPKTGF
jgi:hypothetical protein